jgi:surface polysaccharide O-acyltransferase-like enzyme
MQRNLALDSLKVLLAVMIVALHGHFLRDFSPGFAYFLENYLFRVGVPIFFMVNGFYFSRIVGNKLKVQAWLKRIATIYLTWTVVYGYFLWPREEGVLGSVLSLLTTLATGYWHLWYLLATLLAGVVIYLFKGIADKALLAILIGLYGIGVFLQYVGSYELFPGTLLGAIAGNHLYYRNFLFFGLPMFGAGFWFAKTDLAKILSTQLKVALFGIGLGLLILECLINLKLGLSYSVGFDMLLSLPILCAAVFLSAAAAKRKTTTTYLTEISAVIYFVHPFFLLTLPKFGLRSETGTTLLAVFASLALAPLVIKLNKRCPIFL